MPALAFCENVVQQYWELLDIFFNLQKNEIGNNATFKMYWVKLMCCTYIGYSVCVSIFLPIKQHEACLNWKDSKKSQCKLIQSNKTNKLNQDWDSSDVKNCAYTMALTVCFVVDFFLVMCVRLCSYVICKYLCKFIRTFDETVKLWTSDWWKCTHYYIHMYWIVGKN